MKAINTRIHALSDYLIALVMIALPFMITKPFSIGPYLLPLFGVVSLIISMITNYEWGVLTFISMKRHLLLDIILGLIILISPWIPAFTEVTYLPFLIIGLLKIIISLLSSHLPSYQEYDRYTYRRYDMPMYRKHEKYPV